MITITLPGEKIDDIATAAGDVGERAIVAPPTRRNRRSVLV
ncbi:hypothetical protein [Amycolatopsis pigmentata]|uniref:Uncharacterized protein n=1 Tax=Amycolatopsis pigmentata TaxID=450801 RepID=A0ABW5FSV8_9PSEU